VTKRKKANAGGLPAAETAEGAAAFEVVLENVTKRFAKGAETATAADGVSLAVRRGEFFSLLGPEGAGKSTIMRIIAGFEKPDTGGVFLEGRPVTDLPPEIRRVPMVFQDLALFPHLTVYENIAYGVRLQIPDEETGRLVVESALNRVGLHDLADRRPADLSPGERQRLALARAVALRPRLILFDEPFSHLDNRMRRGLAYEMKRLQTSLGITMVYGTSNAAEALAFSDRIVFLEGGRIRQAGTPEDLYYRPLCRATADFIGETNKLPAVAGKKKEKSRVFVVGNKKMEIPENCLRPLTPDALRDGRRVTLYIKSEHLVQGRDPRGLRGRVVGKFFRGSYTVYAVDVHGFTLRMWRASTGEDLPLAREVFLSFKRDSVLVFEDDTGGDAHVQHV